MFEVHDAQSPFLAGDGTKKTPSLPAGLVFALNSSAHEGAVIPRPLCRVPFQLRGCDVAVDHDQNHASGGIACQVGTRLQDSECLTYRAVFHPPTANKGACHENSPGHAIVSPSHLPSRYLNPHRICAATARSAAKTAGTGGYGINLGARSETLIVRGEENIRRYHPTSGETGTGAMGASGRRFCGQCGSPLWNFDARWPDLIHPHAGAIDDDLPVPPERAHMMLSSAANWVEPDIRENDHTFEAYPDETLAQWHARVAKKQP